MDTGDRIGPNFPLLGVMMTLLAVVMTVVDLFETPQWIHAWRVGAEGEELTGAELRKLEPEGFVALHDRSIRGSRANIDHIVIGPTGVFVVESKSYRGTLSVKADEVVVNGRRRAVVAEVRREVAAVEAVLGPELAALGISVRPFVCVHRATLPLFRSSVAGIPIVYARRLAPVIRDGSAVLSPEQVNGLVQAVERSLPVAS